MLGGVAVLAGGIFAARWYNIGAEVGSDALSAPDALTLTEAGKITLVDIRRPDEWHRTGVPRGAVALDLRRDDFTAALLTQVGGDKDRPIALICARGVRSARLAARLSDAGFTQILDVPEGMMGSGAGPGWLSRGLPVAKR